MRHVARHHGKPARPEPRGGMINHLSEDRAANDDQLLFRSMEMPWNHASERSLQDPREGPAVGSPASTADDRHFTSLSGEN